MYVSVLGQQVRKILSTAAVLFFIGKLTVFWELGSCPNEIRFFLQDYDWFVFCSFSQKWKKNDVSQFYKMKLLHSALWSLTHWSLRQQSCSQIYGTERTIQVDDVLSELKRNLFLCIRPISSIEQQIILMNKPLIWFGNFWYCRKHLPCTWYFRY